MRRLLATAALFLAPLQCFATSGYFTMTSDAGQVAEATDYATLELSKAPAGFWTALSDASDTDGHTIRVYKSDHTTAVAFYIVAIDTTGHTGRLLTAKGELSSLSNGVWIIEGGNSALSSASNSAAVFSGTNVVLAYSLTGSDALVNLVNPGTYNLTAYNSPTSGQAGPVEGLESYLFDDASSQYLMNSSTPITSWPISIMHFSKPDAVATMTAAAFGKSSSNFVDWMDANFASAGANVQAQISLRGGSGSTSSKNHTTSQSINTWLRIAESRDANTGTSSIRIMGTSTQTDTTTVATATFGRFAIGAQPRSGITQYFSGYRSWTEVNSAARSDNYWSTLNAMWLDAASFWTAGTWTADSSGPTKHPWFYWRYRK